MNLSVLEKKIELKKIIREAKGYDSENRFFDLCSLNPIDFRKNLDTTTEYLSITKVHVDKIINNACADVNKHQIKKKLYELFDFDESLDIYRKQFYWVDLGSGIGSEQGSKRPALVIQNNVGNRHSPTVTILPITSVTKGKHLPVHVLVDELVTDLPKDSVVLAEQIRTIDKKRVLEYIGECPHYIMKIVEKALKIQLDIYNPIDVPDFVEGYVEKYSLNNKYRYTLANYSKQYFEDKDIDITNNIDNYINEVRNNVIKEKMQSTEIRIPAYA